MVALYVQVIALLAIAYLAGALLATIIRRSLYKPAVPLPVGERRVDPLPEFVRGPAVPAPAPAVPAARTQAIVTPPPAVEPPQDLKRIRLIDVATESALSRAGVFRYAQIAGWTAADVARVSQLLGIGDRINEENWIEQAQVLAKGGETAYARRRARGEIATAIPGSDGMGISPSVASALLRPQPSTGGASAVVAEIIQPPMPRARVNQQAVTQAAPAPVAAAPAAPAATASPPDVSSRAAFAVERGRVAVPIRPASQPEQENLQRIGSIDAGLAAALNVAGIHRYIQIATWSPQDVEHFEKVLGTGGRIARENWIEQAQILSRGGDTAFSRQHDRANGIAPPPAVPAAALPRSPASAPAAAATASEPEPVRRLRGEPDDLKRIRGIGVLIEKKLNSMGITGYDAIANWTAGDIDRVSQSLDFKGRIERENWVEQARILASGGATEFSRRVDRGDVETSRART